MTNGVNSFIEQLQNIMKQLRRHSDRLLQSMEDVSDKVAVSNDNANSVSSAMEEMSASMEEISATVTSISDGGNNVLTEVHEMKNNVGRGSEIVEKIRNNAISMQEKVLLLLLRKYVHLLMGVRRQPIIFRISVNR